MFFSKPLKEVTYQDVLDFCSQKVKENSVLDYKVDFPSKLEKVLSAFANTYGGLVIIGVGDKDGFPEKNPIGIKFERGLEEKVMGIVLGNIQPPFFPEVQVCPEVKGKTFVLIQVPQSSNTPHAIENNTLVYLRTGNITTPEKIANLDELHWLSKQRENSIILRSDVINFVTDRYQSLCKHHSAKINFGELNVYIVPQYPQYLSFDIKALKDEAVTLEVNTLSGSVFPSFNAARIQTMQDAMYIFINNKVESSEFTEYTAFHSTGLLLHNEDIGHIETNEDDTNSNYIYLLTAVDSYFNLLRFYNNLRNKIGIWGDFKIQIALLKLDDVITVPLNSTRHGASSYLGKRYIYDRVLSSSVLKDNKSIVNELIDFTTDLHWSFDYPLDESTVRQRLEERYKSYLTP